MLLHRCQAQGCRELIDASDAYCSNHDDLSQSWKSKGTKPVVTLVLTYAICTGIKSTPINNRWLPLLSVLVGTGIGLLVGVFIEPKYLIDNLIVGALGGANATWLDQVIKQLMNGKDMEGSKHEQTN